LLFLYASLHAKDTLVFAPLPIENKKILYDKFYPMIEYLEKKLDKKILFNYSNSYADILKKFQDKEIDFAYLGPLPYIELKKKYPDALPIVNFKNEEGETTYTCSLVTFIKNTSSDKVALTQALSTCGYLSVNSLLNNNLSKHKYRYLGRHDIVALEIIKGNYDIGGVKSSIVKDYYHLGLEEVARTKELPTFAIVANSQSLSKDEIKSIKNSLLHVSKDTLKDWDTSMKYGAKEANDGLYDELRVMTKDIIIPQKSNF
jgi:phosphonate transport system substrate-binding protein